MLSRDLECVMTPKDKIVAEITRYCIAGATGLIAVLCVAVFADSVMPAGLRLLAVFVGVVYFVITFSILNYESL